MMIKRFQKGFESKQKEREGNPFFLLFGGSETKPKRDVVISDAREMAEDHGSPKYNPRMFFAN